MSCSTNGVLAPTAKSTALAQQANMQGVSLSWLVERFGPALSEILLELLIKKSVHGVLPGGPNTATLDAFGGFDIKNLLEMMFEKFGPVLIEKLAAQLDTRTEVWAKVAASALRQYAPQLVQLILDLIKSPTGAQVLNDTVAQVLSAP